MKNVMVFIVVCLSLLVWTTAYCQEDVLEEPSEETVEIVEEGAIEAVEEEALEAAEESAIEAVEEESVEAAEVETEEPKELRFGATPFVFTDPNTGFGGGAAGIIRDLGKEARDMSATVIYTSNAYETYMIDLTEPHLFSENGWGKIYISYDSAPVKRFYGFGNDSLEDNVCNWRSHSFSLEPRYTYWIKPTVWGFRAQLHFEDYKALDSDIDVDEENDTTRPISEVWPDIYARDDVQDGAILVGPALFLTHDNRSDLAPVGGGREEKVFPTRGGRQELVMEIYDNAFGSDLEYSRVSFDARHFFPLSEDELSVLGVRGSIVSLGGEVPFWKHTGFGSGDSLRGYHGNRFLDRHSVLFNAELRQALDVGTSLFDGRITLKYPMIVLFYDYGRVYYELEDVFDELYGFHDSYGAAFRFIVTPSIVIRFEYAFSDEETDYYVNAGHAF